MATKGIPEGDPNVAPYLAVDDAAKAIEFYEKAFGAKERLRVETPDKKIGHAVLEVGNSLVMLADPFPWFSTRPPAEIGGTSAGILLYVEDVDAVVKTALDAGAKMGNEVGDQFWGDRFGTVINPFGHAWLLATRVEDLTPEQITERAREAMAR